MNRGVIVHLTRISLLPMEYLYFPSSNGIVIISSRGCSSFARERKWGYSVSEVGQVLHLLF